MAKAPKPARRVTGPTQLLPVLKRLSINGVTYEVDGEVELDHDGYTELRAFGAVPEIDWDAPEPKTETPQS